MFKNYAWREYPGVIEHDVISRQTLTSGLVGESVSIRVGEDIVPLEPVKAAEDGVRIVEFMI